VIRRRLTLGVCVALFAGTLAFRLLDPVLLNDHFEHVSMAMQIVDGEAPGADFFDPGRPLQEYLSAAGLWAFGHQRLAEVLLCAVFLAAASAVVVVVGADLSGSVLLGTLAALLVTAIGPRLYAYPKIVVGALTLMTCGWYADEPSRVRLAWLGAVTPIAFYFRYDYGLYVGATMVAVLVTRHWGDRRSLVNAIAGFTVVTTLCCGPYLAWIASMGAFASGPGTGRLTRLIAGEDLVSLRRFTVPLLTETNAAVWLYDVFLLLPLVAGIVLARHVARGTVDGTRAAKLVGAIVLSVFFNVFLIRGNLDSRLPDVVVPAAVLMAWMLSLCRPARRAAATRRSLTSVIAAVALAASVGLAVNVYASPMTHLARTELLSGPRRTQGHLLAVLRELGGSPLDAYAGSGAPGLPRLTRYLARCTEPADHLLVTGYRPEVYFYANRRFAGGIVAFHANLGAAPRDQQLIVDRLRHQQVPIVVEPLDDTEITTVYPIVATYLESRYLMAAASTFGADGPVFRVLVDRARQPSHVDPELGLPCFAPEGEDH
jgi:hypothetical protein